MIFQSPVTQPGTGLTWGATGYYAVGANVAGPLTTTYYDPIQPNSIGADALKMFHTLFQQWGAVEDHVAAFTPYNELEAYQTDEVAAGRDPLLVTSGGQPVYFNSSTAYYLQAINVCDPRYVRFFANELARKTMLSPSDPGSEVTPQYPNAWVSLDDGTFLYSNYTLTLNGSSPKWDPIFPQSQEAWNTCISSFFSQMAQIAPDVHLMQNQGSLFEADGSSGNHDLTLFQKIYANISGLFREEAWSLPASLEDGTNREDWYDAILDIQWALQRGKPVLLRFPCDGSASQIESAAVGYLLVKDGNSFFSESTDAADEIDPNSPVFSYSRMFDLLGNPTGPLQLTSFRSSDYGFNVYWREFEGGIVYLNWSGAQQTIALPAGTWYDQNGNQVSSLAIPDVSSSRDAAAGTYVTRQRGARVTKPTTSPLSGTPVTGPVTVTLNDATPGAVIHYTLDGSMPSCSSTTYVEPFQIVATTTITAIACNASYGLPSWEDQTTLTLTSSAPTADFVVATDSESPFFTTTYAPIALSNPSALEVRVNYIVSGDGGVTFYPSSGSITFQPFETAKAIPIRVSLINNAPGSVTVTLTGAAGANIGPSGKYVYTVRPNDTARATKWINLHPAANAEGDSSNPAKNYGDDSTLFTGHASLGQNLRSLWKFDLSLIPADTTLSSAILTGYLPTNQDAANSGIPVTVYRMISPWTQNTATWNAIAGNPANWAVAPTAMATAHGTGSGNPAANHWELTADVRAMLSGIYPNYGWIMMGPEDAQQPEYYAWYTDNLHVPDAQPSLYLTYSVPNGSPGTAAPLISGVLNAASYETTAVSPGEAIAIFGLNLGPTAGASGEITGGKLASSLSGVEVLFDGVAAPLVYASASQVNAIVPYEVTGKQTSLVVSYNAVESAPLVLLTAPAAPGLFATRSQGIGQGVIYNADGNPNSASNPALAGSTISLYGTGEGSLSPPGVTGQVYSFEPHETIAGRVRATVADFTAGIAYAGPVPGCVEGIFQINITLPNDVASGNQPVLVTIDGVPSQSGLTVAIK